MLRASCRASLRSPSQVPSRTAALRVPACTAAPRRFYAKDKGASADKAAAQAAENKAIKERAAQETRNLQNLEQQLRVVEKDESINQPIYPYREARLEILREEIGPQGLRPHLTQKTRDMMYSLHVANPEKWTDEALARKFGLLTARVRAILYLKKLEAIARERGEWVSPTDELDEAYENEFGKLEIGFDENADADMKYEDMNSRLPPQMFIDEELDPAEMRARMKAMAPFEDELPEQPPKDWPDQPTVLRKPQPGKPRKYKSKVLLMDTSKGVKDEERMILITEEDGTLRTATWNERRGVLNKMITARTTSGRRNIWLPFGAAAKLQRYRLDKEELIGTLMNVVEAKETAEGREKLEIARRIFTSHGATHGWRKMKDLLKFSDQSLTETLANKLDGVDFERSPALKPELDEGQDSRPTR